MKLTLTVLLMISALSITACGGSSDSSKDLFSLWREVGTDVPLDLTGGEFGSPFGLSVFFEDGSQCDCSLTLLGDQSSGSYVVNFCTYRFGSGSGDPGCNFLNDTGSYSKSSNELKTTDSSGFTTTYR